MAVDFCPENTITTATTTAWPRPSATAAVTGSPRISFSRDLSEHEALREHGRLDESLILDVLGSPATSDFDFCVAGEGRHHEPSTADELFSDGKILPIPIQHRNQGYPSTQAPNSVPPSLTPLVSPLPPLRPPPAPLKEMIACGEDDGEPDKPPPASQKTSTSFWKFGRSNSLNCGGGHGHGHGHMASIICSMTLLTRSKSTGSSNLKPNPNPQQKQQLRKTASNRSSTGKVSRTNFNSSSASSSSNSSYYYGSFHSGNNGVRISPVLNVPHPCIPKGSGGGNGFFGFGRLLCSGKEKSSRKQRSLFSSPHSS